MTRYIIAAAAIAILIGVAIVAAQADTLGLERAQLDACMAHQSVAYLRSPAFADPVEINRWEGWRRAFTEADKPCSAPLMDFLHACLRDGLLQAECIDQAVEEEFRAFPYRRY